MTKEKETQVNLFGTQPKTELTMSGSFKAAPKKEEPAKEGYGFGDGWTDPERTVAAGEQQEGDGWSDPVVRAALDRTKEEGSDYVCLDLMTHIDLDGTTYRVNESSASEMPHHMMGSCWGGGGSDFKLETAKDYFAKKLERKKEHAAQPYRMPEKDEDYQYYYRKIPIKNFVFIISKKLKTMLLEKGFDFEAWNKEYMAIGENLPTPEYDAKVAKAKELIRLGNNNVEKARLCKNSLRNKLGEKTKYGSPMLDSFPDKSLDELKALIDGMKQETLKLEREVRIIYDELKITCYGDIIRGVNEMTEVL